MEKNYTYDQLQVWRSAQTVAQKICNLTNYFPEEDTTDLINTIRSNAQSLSDQIKIELQEKEDLEVITLYQKSLELLNKLEGNLIDAYDQGCITERELKTTLEATNIYSHCLKTHRNNKKGKHLLIEHLDNQTGNFSDFLD